MPLLGRAVSVRVGVHFAAASLPFRLVRSKVGRVLGKDESAEHYLHEAQLSAPYGAVQASGPVSQLNHGAHFWFCGSWCGKTWYAAREVG